MTGSREGIRNIPENIGKLSKFTGFGLPGNKLSRLPDSFGYLLALPRLDLSYNQLTELPKPIGNSS